MAQVTLFKYLIISNNYFTMNGFTDKDTILVIFEQIFWYICNKNFNLLRPAVQFFPEKSHNWCKKKEKKLSQVKMLVVLHQLQKEWILFYLKWAWNECLHLRTFEMSIDMGSSKVDWVVGTGYCFWVFSMSRFALPALSSVDDPDWPGGGGQGRHEQKRFVLHGGPKWPFICLDTSPVWSLHWFAMSNPHWLISSNAWDLT